MYILLYVLLCVLYAFVVQKNFMSFIVVQKKTQVDAEYL